ncbi:hypothetical protein AB0D29_13690 [Streptomyces sp. NPDC048424]|uniref:hypothetical protein n=1 Tax=Streptomyces sp. NPDC048424 TaxID=3155265 RepID=UPI00344A04D4
MRTRAERKTGKSSTKIAPGSHLDPAGGTVPGSRVSAASTSSMLRPDVPAG